MLHISNRRQLAMRFPNIAELRESRELLNWLTTPATTTTHIFWLRRLRAVRKIKNFSEKNPVAALLIKRRIILFY